MELTHTDKAGQASMVDVGEKDITQRTAIAVGEIKMSPETLKLIKENSIKKGDVLSCSRIAGIMGGKKTSELIPLCHIIPIDKISVEFEFSGDNTIIIKSFAKCTYKTGIEMEALTAVSVSALTIYDMCKAVDRNMVISNIHLLHKDGGRSGVYDCE